MSLIITILAYRKKEQNEHPLSNPIGLPVQLFNTKISDLWQS